MAAAKDTLRGVQARLQREHVGLLAAGVAFRALLAVFPSIVAAISVWGLVTSPEAIARQAARLAELLPEAAATLLADQMAQVAGSHPGALSFALVVSVLLALWGASGGVAGLVEGCSAAYGRVDERAFARRRGMAILWTLGAIVVVLVALAAIAVLPLLLRWVGLGRLGGLAALLAPWPLLGLLMLASLAVLYRRASGASAEAGATPERQAAARNRTSWLTPGALTATGLWLVGSALFTLYVDRFGNMGEAYGAFAGIIVLMLWLNLSAFVVLLGAVVNAETANRPTR